MSSLYTKEAVKVAAQLQWPKSLVIAMNTGRHSVLPHLECMLVRYDGGNAHSVYVGTSWRDVADQARLSLPEQPTQGVRRAAPFYGVK
jgi:hypothetical protein